MSTEVPTEGRFKESRKFFILLLRLIYFVTFNDGTGNEHTAIVKDFILKNILKIRENLEKKNIVIYDDETSFNLLANPKDDDDPPGPIKYLLYTLYLELEELEKLYQKMEIVAEIIDKKYILDDISKEKAIQSITYDRIMPIYNKFNSKILEQQKKRIQEEPPIGGKVGKYTKKRKSKRKKRKSKHKKRKSKRKKRKSKRKKRKIKKYK